VLPPGGSSQTDTVVALWSWVSACGLLRSAQLEEAATLVDCLQIRKEIHKNVNCYCGPVERHILIFPFSFFVR